MLKIIKNIFDSKKPLVINYRKQGNEYLSVGDLNSATQCYKRAIIENPSNAENHISLGFVLNEQQQYDAAINHLEKALAINSNEVDAVYLLGIVHQNQNEPKKAMHYFKRAIEINPAFEFAYKNLYSVLMNNKNHDLAEDVLISGIENNSNSAELYYMLGEHYAQHNAFEKALKHLNNSLSIAPDQPLIYYKIGEILQNQQKFDEAIAHYKKAISVQPKLVEAYNNMGSIFYLQKNFNLAADTFKRAVNIEPNNATIYFNLGNALMGQKQYDEAILNFKKSINLDSEFSNAYNNLGIIYIETNQFEQALEHLNQAIRINPNYIEAYVNYGISLQMLRRFEEAITTYNKALSLNSHFEYLLGKLLLAKMKICDWEGLQSYIDKLIKQIEKKEKVSTAFLLFVLLSSPSILRKAIESWSKDKHPSNFSLGNIAKYPKPVKIRVGYFSADFNLHPVSILLAELFELHDKNRFELIAFSLGSGVKDEMTKRLEHAFNQFIDVANQSDEAVAQQARQMKIDIAIDLGGDTANARPGIFSYRAAPIQVSYLGFPGTMGADYFDYIIADRTVIPSQSQQYYTEKIAYLPCYQPGDSNRVISEKLFSREDLGLPIQGFVFCCFNDSYKITPSTWNGWMRILKAVPDSLLLLYSNNELAQENLRKAANANEVDPSRLIFAQRLNERSDYLARYKSIDLFLDTFPYNAHATANDALWAGLPIITLTGDTFASRVAASLLQALNMPELITHTQQDYETLAIELASNPEKMCAIRKKLADNRLNAPLFNTRLYAKHIEAAYIQMIERYHADLAPDHIYI